MSTGNLDVDRQILMLLNDRDMLSACSVNKYYNKKVCSEAFFQDRLQFFYPNLFALAKISKEETLNFSWKKFYLEKAYYFGKLEEEYGFNYRLDVISPEMEYYRLRLRDLIRSLSVKNDPIYINRHEKEALIKLNNKLNYRTINNLLSVDTDTIKKTIFNEIFNEDMTYNGRLLPTWSGVENKNEHLPVAPPDSIFSRIKFNANMGKYKRDISEDDLGEWYYKLTNPFYRLNYPDIYLYKMGPEGTRYDFVSALIASTSWIFHNFRPAYFSDFTDININNEEKKRFLNKGKLLGVISHFNDVELVLAPNQDIDFHCIEYAGQISKCLILSSLQIFRNIKIVDALYEKKHLFNLIIVYGYNVEHLTRNRKFVNIAGANSIRMFNINDFN
jgi:hypothetical protein